MYLTTIILIYPAKVGNVLKEWYSKDFHKKAYCEPIAKIDEK